MIFDIRKLPFASFDGIEFYYQSSTITGGAKTATIEYINTNKRDIQDLGGLQKTYDIRAFIDNNDNYNTRDKFINSLESGKVGIFIHPEYNKKTVKCINYSAINDITKIGITEFNIIFKEIEDKALLIKSQSNISKLGKLKNAISESLNGIMSNQWIKDTRQTFGKTKTTFERYVKELQVIQSNISQAGSKANDFSTYINEAISDVGRLIRTPQDLADSFSTAFSNLTLAFLRSEDLFSNISSLYNFEGEPAQGNSGASRIGQNNKSLIENQIKINALILGYEAGAKIEYKTLESLNKNIELLETAYNNIQKNAPSSVLRNLQDIRIEFNNIINDLSISLPRISEFKTNNISLNVLCHKLYGNLDLKEDIKQINNIIDSSNIEGTIKIFSNV